MFPATPVLLISLADGKTEAKIESLCSFYYGTGGMMSLCFLFFKYNNTKEES